MSEIKVELQAFHGTDRDIGEAAWTSSLTKVGKSKRSDEDVARVVKMLADEGHAVPFEHNYIRFWMKLPIAIDRQVVKHRIGTSHSGMSGRYRTMLPEFLSMSEDVKLILEKAHLRSGINDYRYYCQQAHDEYEDICVNLKDSKLAEDITNDEYKRAREFLRGMLPQHSMTETVMSFNLRSLVHFVKLRDKPNAQPEIQYIAKEMIRLLKEAGFCPVAMSHIEQNGWKL